MIHNAATKYGIGGFEMDLVLSIALVVVLLWATGITIFHFYWNPLPFPDRGSRIFTSPTVEAQVAVVDLLSEFGLPPRFRLDTTQVKRALMRDGVTIINVTDQELLSRMGNPGAGLALVVDDPLVAARVAKLFLEDRQFTAEILEDADPDAPSNSLVFLRSDAFGGWILVFRKHVIKMGPKPPKW